MILYNLTCPTCFYKTQVITRHGRFTGLGDDLERCPACQRWIVPIVEKREYPDSLDYNQFKKM